MNLGGRACPQPDKSVRLWSTLTVLQTGSTGIHSPYWEHASSPPFSSTGYFCYFCLSRLSGCAEVSHCGLIDISLVTNETERFSMVYWPFVCLHFSFIQMGIVQDSILFLPLPPPCSAFELNLRQRGVGSPLFASLSCASLSCSVSCVKTPGLSLPPSPRRWAWGCLVDDRVIMCLCFLHLVNSRGREGLRSECSGV